MVKRIVAWCAVIFGGAVTLESVFIAHRPNWLWILILLLGIAYFAKNGFMAPRNAPPPAAGGSA
jgi:hypothetical protein